MVDRSDWKNEELAPEGATSTSETPPETPWSPQEADDLIRLAADPVCPVCGEVLGVVCRRATDKRQPFPCGCERTPRMGMCACDEFVCPRCGYHASFQQRIQSATQQQQELQREFTIALPQELFGFGGRR
jgi:hypothetical protein